MTPDRPRHVASSMLRSLGSLSVADSHLGRIRRDIEGFPAGLLMSGWCDFADYLHRLADGVVQAAVVARDAASPLVVVDGNRRRYTMGTESVDALTAKLEQHSRMAYLIGYEASGASTAPTDPPPESGSVQAYLPPLEAGS